MPELEKNHTEGRLLLIDDEDRLRELTRRLIEPAGFRVEEAGSAEEGLRLAERTDFDLILCDVRMKGMSGIDLVRQLRNRGDQTSVIVMSAYGGADLAMEAVAAGAVDFLFKPLRADELLFRLGRALQVQKLKRENRRLQGSPVLDPLQEVVAVSPPMKGVVDRVRRVAPFKTTVLLMGESGTGKELIARTLHRLSPRAGKPFVAVNCAAIPETLLETELFGHARGAFTGAVRAKLGLFEEADQGTLLLDEIADLPLPLQVKLLRVLQEGEVRRVGEVQPNRVDVRVLAATSRDLASLVQSGAFREDLFYRLNVISILLPPLRERREDLPILVDRILKGIAQRLGREPARLTSEAMRVVSKAPWRGNVRELENALEGAAVLSSTGVISAEEITPSEITEGGGGSGPAPIQIPAASLSLRALEHALESVAIRRALEQTEGNRTRAAKLLGISIRALLYKMKEHGLGGPPVSHEATAQEVPHP